MHSTQRNLATGLPLLAAVLLLAPAAGFAQSSATSAQDDQTTGVSHPELLNDDINAAPPVQHYQKPSTAVPMNGPQAATQAAGTQSQTYSDTYVPYTPQLQTRTPSQDHYVPRNGQSGGYTQAPAQPVVDDDLTSGVVTSVPTGPNELPIGTRIVGHLQDAISTKVTPAGRVFTAVLDEPVMHQGRVLLPAGTFINGRITESHGGRRITGASALRLQPDEIVTPDRAIYRIHAEVVDLDHFRGSHVNREGTIVNNTNPKATVAILGGTTAAATVTGAVIGGGVGAVVGAGIGAGVGTVWWLRQDHQQTLPAGTEIVFGLNDPLIVSTPNF